MNTRFPDERCAITAVLAFALIVAVVCPVFAEDEEQDDVDRLGLAALMIRDGHFERAEAILFAISEEDKDIDLPRLFTLRGLVFLHRGLFVEAKTEFERAAAAGQADPLVYVYLAQAQFGLDDYAASLAALDKAGDAADAISATFELRAQCHWKLEQPEEAFAALEKGRELYPDDTVFVRQMVFFLIEMGLYQQAVGLGSDYLGSETATAEDYLAIGSALRRSGQPDKAKLILESALLSHPDQVPVLIELGYAYLDAGQTLPAANLFDRAARLNPDVSLEAAELYRKNGRSERALFLNAQVEDQQRKVKQRLGILLEMEKYASVAALEPRLSRLGLLGDDEIRYALAYAYFQMGSYDIAEKHLDRVQRADLFRSATELRKAMETCKALTWECY